MSVSSIRNQITSEQNKLSSLQRPLRGYEENLEEMRTAQTELTRIQECYQGEIRAQSSPFNMLLNLEHENLEGVERIKDSVRDSFNGTNESRFATSMSNTFTLIRQKYLRRKRK